MRKEAARLIAAASKIEGEERAAAAEKAKADAKARDEAIVAAGKLPTAEEIAAVRKTAAASGWSKPLLEKLEQLEFAAGAPARLKKMAEDAEREKAEKKAEKLVKKGNQPGDQLTNEGLKAQKLALKVEKLATKASSAADKYFGAKDRKGVNAQKNKEKMKELVAKQAAAIPLEVRMAIRELSRHNIGQDLVDAGVNALKYKKAPGKVSGGEDYERGRGEDGAFTYDSWSDLRREAKRGGTDSKSGSVTHKGVTYKWETEESSNKIGWDPKQFATHGKVTIRVNNKTIFEGEELNIEGG